MKSYWHIFYTMPNFEKKVFKSINSLEIECFLPLYVTLSSWADREKKIEKPLFPSYIFAKLEKRYIFKILNIRGILSVLSTAGKADIITEKEVLLLSEALIYNPSNIAPLDCKKGDQIRILSGPLKDLEGMMLWHPGKNKLQLQVPSISKYLYLDMPSTCYEVIKNA